VMTPRLRLRLVPQDDLAFHELFQRACLAACNEVTDIDSRAAADMVQGYLRSHGYPDARVTYTRSYDEFVKHVSHWLVIRGDNSHRVAQAHESIREHKEAGRSI